MQVSISRCQGSTGSANRYGHDVDLSFPPRHVLERDIAEPRCREKFCPKSQGLLAVRAAALLTEMWTTEVDLIDGDALELSSRTVFVVSHCTWWCQMPCRSRACAHEAFSQTTNRPPFNHAPAERRSPSPRWFRRARWIWMCPCASPFTVTAHRPVDIAYNIGAQAIHGSRVALQIKDCKL